MRQRDTRKVEIKDFRREYQPQKYVQDNSRPHPEQSFFYFQSKHLPISIEHRLNKLYNGSKPLHQYKFTRRMFQIIVEFHLLLLINKNCFVFCYYCFTYRSVTPSRTGDIACRYLEGLSKYFKQFVKCSYSAFENIILPQIFVTV